MTILCEMAIVYVTLYMIKGYDDDLYTMTMIYDIIYYTLWWRQTVTIICDIIIFDIIYYDACIMFCFAFNMTVYSSRIVLQYIFPLCYIVICLRTYVYYK